MLRESFKLRKQKWSLWLSWPKLGLAVTNQVSQVKERTMLVKVGAQSLTITNSINQSATNMQKIKTLLISQEENFSQAHCLNQRPGFMTKFISSSVCPILWKYTLLELDSEELLDCCYYVYVCICLPHQLVIILFECFPKYICTKFLIFNIFTNRSILIHHQFVRKSFILTWTVNFEPGSIGFKLVFEEINLSNSF